MMLWHSRCMRFLWNRRHWLGAEVIPKGVFPSTILSHTCTRTASARSKYLLCDRETCRPALQAVHCIYLFTSKSSENIRATPSDN